MLKFYIFGLADFEDHCQCSRDFCQILGIHSFHSGLKPMLCDGSNLIDNGYGWSALAMDGNGDWWVWFGGSGEGHHDNGFTQTIQCVDRKHDAGPGFLDF